MLQQLPKNDSDDGWNPYQALAGAGVVSELATWVAITSADWVELLQASVLLGLIIGSTFGLVALELAQIGCWFPMAIVLRLGVWLVSAIVVRDDAACRRKRLEENQMLQRIVELKSHSETTS